MKNTSNIITKNTVCITSAIVSYYIGWDDAGEPGDIQLYDATLAVDTKKFKKGDVISTVTFLFSESMVQLYQPTGEVDGDCTKMAVVEEFPIRLVMDV